MPARGVACVVILILAGLACPAFAAPQQKPKSPDPVELWKTFPFVPKVRSGPQANDARNPKPAPAVVVHRSSPTSPQPSPSSSFPVAVFIVFGLVVLALLAYVVRKTYAEIRQSVDAQATLKSRPVAPEADRSPREAHERAQHLEAEVRQMQTAWREEMDEIETRLDTLIRGLSQTKSEFELLPPRDTSNELRIKAIGVDFQRLSAVEHDQ